MAMYIRRASVVDAWRYEHRNDFAGRPEWLAEAVTMGDVQFTANGDIRIVMPDDSSVLVHPGDWIIRSMGAIYACKHDAFIEQYDEAGQ